MSPESWRSILKRYPGFPHSHKSLPNWKSFQSMRSNEGHDAFLCFSTRNYYGQNHKSFMTSQFVFMLFNSKACSIVLKTFIRIFVEKFLFVFLQIMHKSCWKLLFMKLLIISCFYKIKSKKKNVQVEILLVMHFSLTKSFMHFKISFKTICKCDKR